jgi:hypothetical protein
MVKIWRNRIWAGTQVLVNCPARYKTGVMDMMTEDLEDGIHTLAELKQLVENGNVTPEEYKQITGEDYDE